VPKKEESRKVCSGEKKWPTPAGSNTGGGGVRERWRKGNTVGEIGSKREGFIILAAIVNRMLHGSVGGYTGGGGALGGHGDTGGETGGLTVFAVVVDGHLDPDGCVYHAEQRGGQPAPGDAATPAGARKADRVR
jgi:hypothetical protein